MKLSLEPTGTFEKVNGVPCRMWTGTSDKGVKVKAWIAVVQPQTHDDQDFQAELLQVQCDRQLTSFDLRMVLD